MPANLVFRRKIWGARDNGIPPRATPVDMFTFLTFLDHLLVQGRPVFQSFSTFDLVPCLQSVDISSCLTVCCPSISFSVGLCSFSQKLVVLAISHRCGCVLASSSSQTTFVFQESFNRFYVRLLPDVFISDVVEPGLPSQHPHYIFTIFIY